MLSNEMLSIKQQIYEKSETNLSPVYITFKNSIAKPTLELKQLWPLEQFNTQPETKHENEDINKKTQLYTDNDSSKLNNSLKSKVLGVRSFSELPVKHLETSNNNQYAQRQCSCMNTNSHTTCSFRCSEHRKKTCTQIKNFVTEYPQCTKNIIPFSYYPYYVYSTLFLGVTTDSSVIYYHPAVINELKLPKHKYSKIRKPSVDNLYKEENDYKEQNDYQYENEYLENESSDGENHEKTSYSNQKYEKTKTDRPHKGKTIHFINYKEGNSISEADKVRDSYLHVVDKDKFIADVVEDLKVYYSDAVIKDCYCSLSSFTFRTESFIVFIPMLIIICAYNIIVI
ncbi:jg23464 [Pararge aegeria aegeria]|uniref:Jg23464 protein n=1 Tax=Pararge aegeria aegeria TaxID=348720 RepID=A0A8S4RYX4_9NEOP|nr:jg23464 [Pararge aegeria aegeria]